MQISHISKLEYNGRNQAEMYSQGYVQGLKTSLSLLNKNK